MEVLQTLLVVAACLVMTADSVMFYLEANARKCLAEEIRQNILVTGEFEVSEMAGQQVNMMVTDTSGHHLVNRENIEKEGKFAFTTDKDDIFEICFISRVPSNVRGSRQEVFLATKHGVEAKNYENLGDAAKLKPLEVELKRLEDMSESIVQDFAFMRRREEEMRDTNESTNSRVLYFSIFSMCCLLGLATWQVLYLRKYFKSKKLIE